MSSRSVGATEILAERGEGGGREGEGGERERARKSIHSCIFKLFKSYNLQIKESLAILKLFMWKFCTQSGSILYKRIDK